MKKRIFAGLLVMIVAFSQFAVVSFAQEEQPLPDWQDEVILLEEESAEEPLEETPVYGTGVYEVNGVQKYYQNGTFTKVTGIVKRASDGREVYVENGIFTKVTGVARRLADGKWLYVKQGEFQKETGLAKRLTDKKWVYVKKGIFTRATGVAKMISGSKWKYVKKGVFNKHTGVVKSLPDKKWFYVYKGAPTTKINKIKLTGADEKAGLKNHFVEAYARAVVEKITNDSMTEKQKLRACFNYTITHFRSTNNPRIPHYTGADWPYVYAYDMFGPRGGGNCMSFAAAYAFLAKACGCKKVYAINTGGHGWTEVNGKVYDPEQYHDTNRKIYAKKYSDPIISGYWRAVSGASAASHIRMEIKGF